MHDVKSVNGCPCCTVPLATYALAVQVYKGLVTERDDLKEAAAAAAAAAAAQQQTQGQQQQQQIQNHS
jgi:uncharacterized membrane protein